MPHNNTAASGNTEHSGEVNKAEVVERKAINSDERVWQAEIVVPQGGDNHTGRARVFTIRGPPRKNAEAAESDAEQLTKAATEGAKHVRALANSLHRG